MTLQGTTMFLAAVGGALALAVSGASHPAELGRVASIFAQRPVTVACASEARWQRDPLAAGTYGYTIAGGDTAFIEGVFCDGALHVGDDARSTDTRAWGVLILVHEAYHLRDFSKSDAQVECLAIRHWRVALHLLGGTRAVADELWPRVLAYHRMLDAYPLYHDAACRVPPP